VKIIWSDAAREDLRAIQNYMARDSVFYADRMVERIITRVSELASQPKQGHHVHEYPEDKRLRELHESSYRIIYSIESAGLIAIVTIVHFARLLKLPIPKKKE
jgi:plasmid stabilization system protein ParE